MRLNPIVKKDVRVQSRSMKISWGVFAYELILALVFFLAMVVIDQNTRYSSDNIYSKLVWLYPTLAVTQLVILGVVVPVRTASSISGEKERQTFDIMMTTDMTPFSIILGKVMTAIVQSMLFVVASMPIMALSFIIGGMSWSYLFWFLALALLASFFAASIGILCSSLCKKSISAVIMTYGFYLIFFLVTFLPYLLYQIASEVYYPPAVSTATYYTYGENWLLLLLVNPAVLMVEFFGKVMMGESVMNGVVRLTGSVRTGGPIRYAVTGDRWVFLSVILLTAVSLLFLLLAARRIDPVRNHARKRKRTKGNG